MVLTPKLYATILLKPRVSLEEWRSGINSPKTLSFPRAFTQRPETLLLSIPPDMATIRPCLFKSFETIDFIFYAILHCE